MRFIDSGGRPTAQLIVTEEDVDLTLQVCLELVTNGTVTERVVSVMVSSNCESNFKSVAIIMLSLIIWEVWS